MDADTSHDNSPATMQARALAHIREARLKQDLELKEELESKRAPLIRKVVDIYQERSRYEERIRALMQEADLTQHDVERIERNHDEKLNRIAKERREENESRRNFFRTQLGDAADIWISDEVMSTCNPATSRPTNGTKTHLGNAMDVDQPQSPVHKVAMRTKLPSSSNKGNANGTHASADAKSGRLPVLAPAPIPTIEEPQEERVGRSTEPAVNSRGGFTPVNVRSVANTPSRDVSTTRSETAGTGPKPPRRSLPEGRLSSAKAVSPFSRRVAKSPVPSDVGTPRGGESDDGVDVDMDLPEITRATLSLEHDGNVYTAPELMVGVPVRRIDDTDDYWEPSWKPMKEKFAEQFHNFELKHAALKAGDFSSLGDEDDIKPSTRKNTQMQIGRQVNRGRQLMEFFKDDTHINPYQLVSKRFITAGFCNYDTIFRLVSTLDELKKFPLDVTPLEWIRQRLWEIYSEDKLGFQLNKIVHNFYRDAKLSALRSKAGFGNIGRPFGGGRPRKSLNSGGDGSERDTPAKRGRTKRKEPHGVAAQNRHSPGDLQVDSRRASESGDSAVHDVQSHHGQNGHDSTTQPQTKTELSSPPSTKRLRLEEPDDEPSKSDLEYDGYTTTEDLIDDKLLPTDWEVEEVKSAERTTTTDASTYWHWVEADDDTDKPYMEHQVLAGTNPTVWSCYKGFDFNLRPEELKEVLFAPGSNYVVINKRNEVKGGDGDLVAQFPRQRTRKRFIKFLKDRGVRIVKTDSETVNSTWKSIKPRLGPEGPLDD
ncbi:hypothetical protein MCOR27_009313 [Pyricularia oryzae]|nr:hypothetical protein MCOR27_009313 [Pyricularia oryzae]KAI6352234.1 hypothetical protein MCOR32_011402 [Pyricularia oryzae]